jgi:uncharacterized protein (DUF433 family)
MRIKTSAPPARSEALNGALSSTEAAFVVGLSVKAVNAVVDRREIGARGGSKAGTRQRRFGYPELVYLALRRDLVKSLTRPVRIKVYQSLREKWAQGSSSAVQSEFVEFGDLRVSLVRAVRQVTQRLALLHDAEQHVVSDSEIRGGERVVRGTHVPVHRLADLHKQGVGEADLLADHPSVTPRGLRAALTYAATHPKRGRPAHAPWRDHGAAGSRRVSR